jgi:gluconolactonase
MKKQLIYVLAIIMGAAAVPVRAQNYVPTGAVTKVADVTTGSGWTHTEGPVFDGNGGILFGELNSNHTSGIIWRHQIDGPIKNATQVVASSGGTQGAHRLNATQFVTADRDTRRISIREASNLNTITSSVSTIAGSPGVQFNGPNDIAVDAAGGIYFTDPNFEGFSNTPGVDGVYYIAPGATTATRILNHGTSRTNGIALSPDQKTLYTGLFQTGQLLKYTLNTPGVPTGAAAMGAYTSLDGFMVDPWGNLILSRSGGITCLSPKGASLFELNTGSSVTNVEIGTGASGTYLYFTQGFSNANIGLYRVQLNVVPEPGTLAMVGLGAVLMLRRGRRSSVTAL